MKCPICQQAAARIGVLCETCRDELVGRVAITQEQLQTHGAPDSAAVLIDSWGGLHRLGVETTVGRAAVAPALTILEPSVSRRHAVISYVDRVWTVRDLGSAHGTFVDDWPADQPLELRTGSKLRFGYVGFFFVDDARELAARISLPVMSQTSRPSKTLAAIASQLAAHPSPPIEAKTRELERITFLPVMNIQLHEPTGGGGGVVEIEGTCMQLTLPQYELVVRLVRRMLDEVGKPDDVRGFIAPTELVRILSLDSLDPGSDNVRQLVSRLRRACIKAGLPDLIETRYRLGYRLSVMPRIK
ncbi:MAG: FHA domain-containing protein [Myxococcota bacterium]|nr:FHA domain-containing protein [Myxococcota bacterium]